MKGKKILSSFEEVINIPLKGTALSHVGYVNLLTNGYQNEKH